MFGIKHTLADLTQGHIIFMGLENKCPLNGLNFLTLKITNPLIPYNDIINMHIVCH